MVALFAQVCGANVWCTVNHYFRLTTCYIIRQREECRSLLLHQSLRVCGTEHVLVSRVEREVVWGNLTEIMRVCKWKVFVRVRVYLHYFLILSFVGHVNIQQGPDSRVSL